MTSTRSVLHAALAAACLTALRLPAAGNDGVIYMAGGSAKAQEQENADVSMDSEVVRITLGYEDYSVEVSFDFFNHGASTEILVGFPQESIADPVGNVGAPPEHFIRDFQTWVDGKPYPVETAAGQVLVRERDETPRTKGVGKRRMPERWDDTGEKDFAKWYASGEEGREGSDISNRYYYSEVMKLDWFVKKVRFEGGRKTAIKVRYSTRYGVNGSGSYWARYIYGTGRTWKGDIGQARFIVDASQRDGDFEMSYRFSDARRPFAVSTLGRGVCQYLISAIKPDENELLELRVPTGESGGFDAGPGQEFYFKQYADWEYQKEVIPDALLGGKRPWQLRLLRNMFFAGHGKRFQDPGLARYFEARSWYHPKDDFKNTDLNEIEKANVRKIQGLEQKKREEPRCP
jgi:hypothetical protein